MSTVALIAGIVGMALLVAGLGVARLAALHSPAVGARPAAAPPRRIRALQIGLLVIGVLIGIGLPSTLGVIDRQARARVDHAAATALVRQLAQESAALDTAFRQAEAAVRLDRALAPERMVTRSGIADARRRLTQWSLGIDRWEAGKTALAAQFETRMMGLSMSGAEREAAGSAYRRAYQESRALLNDFIGAKREAIAAARELLDLIESRLSGVRTQDGRLVFSEEADALRSNALAERLAAAGRREASMAGTLQTRARTFEEKLQQFAGQQ